MGLDVTSFCYQNVHSVLYLVVGFTTSYGVAHLGTGMFDEECCCLQRKRLHRVSQTIMLVVASNG